MRTYEKTHPWLKFELNLGHFPAKLWVMLGECQSKCEHVAGMPLRPETQKELYGIYLAKGALATTAIEGNTLTEQQVLDHLSGKLELPPSREYLASEIDNIIEGCNLILSEIEDGKIPKLSVERIKELNRIVLKGLKLPEEVEPGVIRQHSVGVPGYRGAPASDCEYLLSKMCDWLNTDNSESQPGMHLIYPIIKAVLAHLYLAWIHPFGDGNGRTARFVEFQILISSGVPALSAHLLSNHYNITRAEYYRQLDAASKSGGDILPFLLYAVEGFRDGLLEQINRIRSQQLDVIWRSYVHETFRDFRGHVGKRRRDLVLDLSRRDKAEVDIDDVISLSGRMAQAYSGRARKMIQTDIKALIALGLLQKQGNKIRACKEVIKAYLPPRVNPSC
jgi:Fic family protein